MKADNNAVIPNRLMDNYLDSLVNQFFKILPLRENEETSLISYMSSLQRELIGCRSLLQGTDYDAGIARLIFTLQFMMENECSIPVIKSEVFKSISLCKKIKNQYINNQKGV